MFIGLDVGGTNMTGGLAAADGELRLKVRRATDRRGGMTAGLGLIVELVSELSEQAARAGSAIERIGVGFGGPVDHERGIVLRSHHVEGWENIPLRDEMRAPLPRPRRHRQRRERRDARRVAIRRGPRVRRFALRQRRDRHRRGRGGGRPPGARRAEPRRRDRPRDPRPRRPGLYVRPAGLPRGVRERRRPRAPRHRGAGAGGERQGRVRAGRGRRPGRATRARPRHRGPGARASARR